MKIAYRISTPILALGAAVAGFFLKMFHFVIGSTDEQIGSLVNLVSQLSNGKLSTTQEFSLFELAKMLRGYGAAAATTGTGEEAKSVTDLLAPIMPQLIAFFVLFAVAALVCIAIAATAAAMRDNKTKRTVIIVMCAFNLAVLIACIVVSNAAFAKVMNGDISIAELVNLFSENPLITLATAILTVTAASLSYGFYTVFGIMILIIIWTIIAGFVIKSPIVPAKKAYRRKVVRGTGGKMKAADKLKEKEKAKAEAKAEV